MRLKLLVPPAHWRKVQAAAADLLAGVTPQIIAETAADSRSTWYRIRIRPAGYAASARLCEALNARDIDCLPVRAATTVRP